MQVESRDRTEPGGVRGGARPARVDDPRPWKRDGLGQQLGERRFVGGRVIEQGLVQQAAAPQQADHLARDLHRERV
jgi:hypothetical protein